MNKQNHDQIISRKKEKTGWLRSAGESLLDLLYPGRCPVCERILLRNEPMICEKCARELPWVREPFCRKCGRMISDPARELCSDCESRLHYFDEGRAAFLYEKGMRRSVDRMKFHNHREYIPFYARSMTAASASVLPVWRPECILPVPMHPKKRAERGFDQSLLLASALGSLTGIRVEERALVRTRYTKASKKLGRESRKKNMRGVFALDPAVRLPARVLLVDDIYTTGTTMDTASHTLRMSGVREIYFLTLCIGRGEE